MSAPLPPLHAMAIVRSAPRIRGAQRRRPARTFPALGRLWRWLMEPIHHGDRLSARAALLAHARQQQQAPRQACARR